MSSDALVSRYAPLRLEGKEERNREIERRTEDSLNSKIEQKKKEQGIGCDDAREGRRDWERQREERDRERERQREEREREEQREERERKIQREEREKEKRERERRRSSITSSVQSGQSASTTKSFRTPYHDTPSSPSSFRRSSRLNSKNDQANETLLSYPYR